MSAPVIARGVISDHGEHVTRVVNAVHVYLLRSWAEMGARWPDDQPGADDECAMGLAYRQFVRRGTA